MSLLPTLSRAPSLAAMSLADAPDFATALAAGEAHGLAPKDALTSAFGKWMTENAEAVERYGLANFYDGVDQSRAMVDYSRLTRLLAIALADTTGRVRELEARIADIEQGRIP